jgi:acetyltransferase
MHITGYERARRALMETPPALSPARYDQPAARAAIARALAQGHRWLDPIETAQVLRAYEIPALPVQVASTPDEAKAAAKSFLENAPAVVIKILSPDIVHKSDVAGVRLNITNVAGAEDAAAAILQDARKTRPNARIDGVAVYPMIARPNAREVFAGIADDPTFGSVIAFGSGGTAVEVVNDKALALPPLNLKSARELIGRTRVSRMLKPYRNVPGVDIDKLAQILVNISNFAADFSEIVELDLNPILADHKDIVILDARIAVQAVPQLHRTENPRFAIRPYPDSWTAVITTRGGIQALTRPVRPEDEHLFAPFLEQVSLEDLRLRFFAPIKDFGHEFVARLTQIDYDRAMAFLAIDEQTGRLLGVARLAADSERRNAEYAILVRSDLKGHGLGWSLMERLIEYARSEGFERIEGQVLNENTTMLQMCRELGFSIEKDSEDDYAKRVSFVLKRR